jgi:hypothetical protein
VHVYIREVKPPRGRIYIIIYRFDSLKRAYIVVGEDTFTLQSQDYVTLKGSNTRLASKEHTASFTKTTALSPLQASQHKPYVIYCNVTLIW